MTAQTKKNKTSKEDDFRNFCFEKIKKKTKMHSVELSDQGYMFCKYHQFYLPLETGNLVIVTFVEVGLQSFGVRE